ncbi:MAG TPA: tautomerase family protein [Candidatus Binatia bacterium]|nr:tautomerase family protein [Candidatus Binatia bacterium]
MPFVRIDVLAGRPPALLEALIEAVSETVARTLDVPIERVRVVINEVPPHLWGIGGVPASRVPGRAPATILADPAADAPDPPREPERRIESKRPAQPKRPAQSHDAAPSKEEHR